MYKKEKENIARYSKSLKTPTGLKVLSAVSSRSTKNVSEKALWILQPPGLPDSWNSFKSQKVQQETSSTFFQILLMLKFLFADFYILNPHFIHTLHCNHFSPAINFTSFQLSVNFSLISWRPSINLSEELSLSLKGHSTNFTFQIICE